MTSWIDIAGIVFVCVTANHLGLISAILETVTKRNHLPIISCPKCLTFWSTLAYMAINEYGIILTLAISFLASYIALWVELLEGIVDELYKKVYDKIYPTPSDYAPAAEPDEGYPAGSVPRLQEDE